MGKSDDRIANTSQRWKWALWPVDDLVRNFSISTLRELAKHGLLSSAAGIFKKDPGQIVPSDCICYPWLIVEYKKGQESTTPVCQAQAANAAVAALMMYRTLARYATPKVVPPVVAMTAVGEAVRIWIAYCDDGDDGSERYVSETLCNGGRGFLIFSILTAEKSMICIWEGDVTTIMGIVELETILENLHTWAMRILRPWISHYIDQWKFHFPLCPRVSGDYQPLGVVNDADQSYLGNYPTTSPISAEVDEQVGVAEAKEGERNRPETKEQEVPRKQIQYTVDVRPRIRRSGPFAERAASPNNFDTESTADGAYPAENAEETGGLSEHGQGESLPATILDSPMKLGSNPESPVSLGNQSGAGLSYRQSSDTPGDSERCFSEAEADVETPDTTFLFSPDGEEPNNNGASEHDSCCSKSTPSKASRLTGHKGERHMSSTGRPSESPEEGSFSSIGSDYSPGANVCRTLWPRHAKRSEASPGTTGSSGTSKSPVSLYNSDSGEERQLGQGVFSFKGTNGTTYIAIPTSSTPEKGDRSGSMKKIPGVCKDNFVTDEDEWEMAHEEQEPPPDYCTTEKEGKWQPASEFALLHVLTLSYLCLSFLLSFLFSLPPLVFFFDAILG